MGIPSQPCLQNAPSWSGSRRLVQHPAAQPQRHSPPMQKEPPQKPRPVTNEYNPGTYGCLSSAKSPPPLQPQPAVAGPSSKQFSSRGVKTYAQVVRQSHERREKAMVTRGMQPPQHLKMSDRSVDPVRESQCFRCMGRGHAVRECRDPIACRLCRLLGHRQASCPLRRAQRPNLPSTGLFDCLVGDVRGEEPSWDHILDGIRTVCPDLTSPDTHRLVSGAIFIRRLSKVDWQKLLGVTQQVPGGISITWRRPQSSDGAFVMHRVIKRLEVRGFPFGLRTWTHLEQIIRPVCTLHKIVYNGLQIGDPNCVCMDIEVDGDKELPNIILTVVEGGRDTKITIAALPPPSPHLCCHNSHIMSLALARQCECHSPQWSINKSAGNPTPAARAARLDCARQVSPQLLHS